MERLIYGDLLGWKGSDRRKPLILRGVRQCGKTHLLKEFGEREYRDVAYFNFEGNSDLSAVFRRNMDVARIVGELSVLRGSEITAETLIIFDEVQFCAAALTSLKYFCEDAPGYHIACAGSLLGLMLPEGRGAGGGSLSFPVGKVDMLTLRPMCYLEFLRATGRGMHADALRRLEPGEEVPESMAGELEAAYREHCAVGGMPEAVLAWAGSRDMGAVERILLNIANSYRSDFTRYAPRGESAKLNRVWESVPGQISKENRRFFFGHAVEGARASQLEDALQWILDAGLAYRVRLTERPGIPLSANASESIFKIYSSDMGLLRTMAGAPAQSILLGDGDFNDFKGGMTENFVMCELASLLGDGAGIAYWKNPKGSAEVDFVAAMGGRIVPIEVKSGRAPRLKSMEEYMRRFEPDRALVVSMENVRTGRVCFVPPYMVWRAREILDAPR
ncbi:MAG: ATP-binding protein [Candidatus Methanoplasma sp.]|nr:ATP-binding protein [Candidatus Methanoplasma sp.]